MHARHLFARGAAAAVLVLAAAPAGAEHRSVPGPRTNLTRANGGGLHGIHDHRGFHGGLHAVPLLIVERPVPVVVEREVVREVPVIVEAPPPPPSPRKPYRIGATYAALPAGCMKLIEEGISYYLCSGEWYRQIGSGSAVQYKAVARR